MSDKVVKKYTVVRTSNGFMVEVEADDGCYESLLVHTPSGDNTFDTYREACMCLSLYLVGEGDDE